MNKKELREKYLELRKTLSADEVSLLSEQIFNRFIEFFNLEKGNNLHLFLSISKFNEVDTSFFTDFCWKKAINVFVPKMLNNRLIAIQLLPNTEMEINSWGIQEPKTNEASEVKSFDYVMTPLLYCDAKGNRVGYGKGFYDAFFSSVKVKNKVGVCFYSPNEKIDDINTFDIALDYLVTPTDMLSFGKEISKSSI